jgi:hypothetical protein
MASYSDPSTTAYYDQPYAGAMRRGFLESAAGLANQPIPVPIRQVAGLDPYQMQARALAGGLGGFAPYLQQGAGMAQQGFGALQQAQGMYNPMAAQQFYNPYEDQVVQQTMRDMQQATAQQGLQDRAGAVGSGAFGGSRGRLMEQERQRQASRGMMEAVGGIRQQGYTQAQNLAQRAGQGLGQLGGQMGQMGRGFADLGMQGQQGLMNQINQFGQLGSQGRDIQQQMYDSQYKGAQEMAMEPWKRMQMYQGMLGMIPQGATTIYGSQAGGGLADLFKMLGYV